MAYDFCTAVEAVGDVFQGFQPLEVELDGVAAGAGTRSADGVSRRDDESLDRPSVVVVVLVDSGGYGRCEGVTPGNLLTELDVRTLELVGEGLADVVEQSTGLGGLDVRFYLTGDQPRDAGDLDGVL